MINILTLSTTKYKQSYHFRQVIGVFFHKKLKSLEIISKKPLPKKNYYGINITLRDAAGRSSAFPSTGPHRFRLLEGGSPEDLRRPGIPICAQDRR